MKNGTIASRFMPMASGQVLDEIHEFISGVRATPEPSRALATITYSENKIHDRISQE